MYEVRLCCRVCHNFLFFLTKKILISFILIMVASPYPSNSKFFSVFRKQAGKMNKRKIKNPRIAFLKGILLSHDRYKPYFKICYIMSQWTCGWFLSFGYFEWCYNKYWTNSSPCSEFLLSPNPLLWLLLLLPPIFWL